ncbi:MAG: transglutaminase domain-containing protein [Oscillospiraceae bacterium]|nr:transglutaminase domain-containing protein [Oscillospiraceae bacterium]
MKQRYRWIAMLLTLLLTAGVLCGCGFGAANAGPEPTATPEPAVTPEATATPSPEEIAAEKEAKKRRERLEAQQDGFVWDRGFLYTVDEEGSLICDRYVGVLYFGAGGRYTSGSKALDRLVAAVIRENTDDSMTRMEKLRAMYDYTRDNIKYVGFGNHDYSYEPAHGEGGWMIECATHALEEGNGNCYHFAATFAALARGLGFQAYAASGVIGSEEQQHGWVEILDGDGKVWYSDPETEYSRIYWLNEQHDLFYKSKDDIGGTTGLGYLKYVDPFEAEKKEAEERANPKSVPSPVVDPEKVLAASGEVQN